MRKTGDRLLETVNVRDEFIGDIGVRSWQKRGGKMYLPNGEGSLER